MNRQRIANTLLRLGEKAVRGWLRSRGEAPTRRSGRRRDRDDSPFRTPTSSPRRSPRPDDRDEHVTNYPGDYTKRPRIEYEANNDDEPDPGEIVWTWVPFEEDHTQGKDRPVLVIGHDGRWLLALQVSTVDADDPGHHAREAGFGRHWLTIGSGDWDTRGRDSEVRVNRIIRIDPDNVRRIGAKLDRERYQRVTDEVLTHY